MKSILNILMFPYDWDGNVAMLKRLIQIGKEVRHWSDEKIKEDAIGNVVLMNEELWRRQTQFLNRTLHNEL